MIEEIRWTQNVVRGTTTVEHTKPKTETKIKETHTNYVRSNSCRVVYYQYQIVHDAC